LRRYLEQRREMGETELVLDALSVEEALRILGGAGGAPPSDALRSTSTNAGTERAPQPAEARPARELPAGADWRETLRAAGAAPDTMPKKTTTHGAGAPPAPPTDDSFAPEQRGSRTAQREPSAAAIPAGLSVGSPAGELFGGFCASLNTLDAIAAAVASCTRCSLYSTATNPVPGEGNPDADFMCVGEAPGATEDETGRPFVGAAGQLLTKILGAINLRREDVYICNVLKHRPPGNRNPRPEEVTACSPYLNRQIELIRPKVILALGTFAAQTLLDTKLPIGKLRGQVHRYYGVPLIVTYHPAALLRNPGWKRPTWEDVQLARRILDSPPKPGA
jgi:DNA polymerase